jgi:two-component system chemotaxis response regulator CheY
MGVFKEEKTAGRASAPGPVREHNVLVVDDYFLIRRNHKLLLERLGFTVYEATNGEEAHRMVSSQGPSFFDVIIIDIMMPVMNGEEFISRMRADFGEDLPRILVCSSASDVPLVKRLASSGIAGYMLKPVDYKALIRKLAEMFPGFIKVQDQTSQGHSSH